VTILPHVAKTVLETASEVILSVAVQICLKWSHDKFKTHDKFEMHDLHIWP